MLSNYKFTVTPAAAMSSAANHYDGVLLLDGLRSDSMSKAWHCECVPSSDACRQ